MSTANAANNLSFVAFCRILDVVEKTPKADDKIRLIFTDSLRRQILGTDMYPFLRLLLPQLDRERTYNLKEKKIAKIYIHLLGMTNASRSQDAGRLENYNDPTIVQSKSVGDFASVLFEVLELRAPVQRGANAQKTQRTLHYVNELLDELASTTQANLYGAEASDDDVDPVQKHEELDGQNLGLTAVPNKKQTSTSTNQRTIFMKILMTFPPAEQKWLTRILLKDLKIGLRHERVLKYIHPDAMEMYNHTNDLHRICLELRNSKIRYVPVIEPFQVFSPMLAKRVDFGSCIQAIGTDSFGMEPKLDGERVICHVQGGKVQFISRNGINYTELYGPGMSSYILSQLAENIDCILDGEMMVWDNLLYRFREFGLLKNVAHSVRDNTSPNRWLCYVVWDLVYLGSSDSDRGNDLVQDVVQQVFHGPGQPQAVMGLPLCVRRTLLQKILTPMDHRVIINPHIVVNAKTAQERHDVVMAQVDKEITNGGEGLILKDLNSHYMCGEASRATRRWIKLKPDYAGMTTNLDVLILGGYYGTGRRRSGDVSVFLVGVLPHTLEEDTISKASTLETLPPFYTFAKVGTGYNLDELTQMRRELEPYWQPWVSENIPPHFSGWQATKSDVRPDVWIDPRHSKVLEVYGFELTYTTAYKTRLTLRFPRCHAIRNDKNWYECSTLQDLSAAQESLSKRKATDIVLGQQAKKRATLSKRTIQDKSVAPEYTQARLEDVSTRSNILRDYEFCVLPGRYPTEDSALTRDAIMAALSSSMKNKLLTDSDVSMDLTKQQVEQIIHCSGGKLVQNPVENSTTFVVAPNAKGLKFENLKRQGHFDILKLRYILGCIAVDTILPLGARDFLFATESTQKALAKNFDRFGDHYTAPISVDELRNLLKDIELTRNVTTETECWQKRMKTELSAEEQQVMEYEYSILSHCVVYVDRFDNVGDDTPSSQLDECGSLGLAAQQLQLYGALVTRNIDTSVTHIVVDRSNSQQRVAKLRPIIQTIRRACVPEPPVVTIDWVQACIHERIQLPVKSYQLCV